MERLSQTFPVWADKIEVNVKIKINGDNFFIGYLFSIKDSYIVYNQSEV
jgi:hypothetical protein